MRKTIKPFQARLLSVVALLLMALGGYAQDEPVASILDNEFKNWFTVLVNNREVYNRYNDSIFLIHDHDQWVEFFHKRASKNHEIYAANKAALDNMHKAIHDGKNQKEIEDAYGSFVRTFFAYFYGKSKSDPFLSLAICDELEYVSSQVPDSMRATNYVNLIRGGCYYQTWLLTHEIATLQKSFDYFKACISDEAKKYPAFTGVYLTAQSSLCSYVWAQNKLETVTDLRNRNKSVRLFLRNHKDLAKRGFKVDRIKARLDAADQSIIRNLYMLDNSVFPKEAAERLMEKLVLMNSRKKTLSDSDFLNMLTMQLHLKQITARQALRRFEPRYEKNVAEMKTKRMSPKEFQQFLTPYSTLFYFNDIADISFSAKRRNVIRMCRDMETAFQNRSDAQSVTNFVDRMNIYVNYDRITRYLKPKERLSFLTKLSVSCHVTTYAHSVHVGEIAKVIMEGVLEHQPSLLVGYLGCKTEASVKRHKKRFMEFIAEAAFYHDLGKNTIIPVVDNDFRPLIPLERDIIKKHPEMGLKYLELDPRLKRYHDTTLGHHKWYNGKGGYPDNFDNTQSAYRFLIDIVTLSDCMQAATERVGRNYKGEKTFEKVMEEFRQDAGTRYNPDLVRLIDASPTMASKLSRLVSDGWVEIYYNIYSQYFVKND